jgi:hypothetical protein
MKMLTVEGLRYNALLLVEREREGEGEAFWVKVTCSLMILCDKLYVVV